MNWIAHIYNVLTIFYTNELDCTHIQCPDNCPLDSYIKSVLHDYDEFDKEDIEDLDDYMEDLITPKPYIEKYEHFEELPPEVELHETNMQHSIKERQKREVFFQEDIERCCGNQKCVCKECDDIPKCLADEVATEVHEGKGEPGNCCSQFKCVKKEKCGMGVKQTWWRNKCTKCSCFGEDDMCIQHCTEEDLIQNCFSEYWGKPMMNGATWKEGSCTSCTCEKGERRCFASKLEAVCHPLYADTKEKEEELEIIEEKLKDLPLEASTTNDSLINTTNSLTANEKSSTVSPLELTIEVMHSTASSKDINSTEVKEIMAEEVMTTILANANVETTTQYSVENKMTTEINSTPTMKSETSVKSLDNSSTVETQTSSSSIENETTTPSEIHSTFTMESEDSLKSLNMSSMLETHTYNSIIPSTTDTSELPDKTETTEIPQSILTHHDDSSDASFSVDNFSTTTTSDIDFTENLEDTSITTTARTSTQITTEKTLIKETSTESSSLEAETLSYTTTASTTTSPTSLTSQYTTDSATTTEVISTPTSTLSQQILLWFPDIFTTNSPMISTISSTTVELTSSSTSTSTTSSPYSSTNFLLSSTLMTSTTADDSSSTSTTSAPQPLEPLFQPVFGDFDKNERATTGTQNQLRHMFDEIDYVVMIVLFIGSLLCISLGLIIRHTKNRKKMYSSIPNSETSLSQTSTNTVMTV